MRTNLRYLKGYYFLDYTHGEKQIFLDRLYETAAKIVIKYGGYGDYLCNIKERYIREFWTYDTNYPVIAAILRHISVKHLKWYLYHKVKYEAEIWNPDFIQGLSRHGVLKLTSNKFDFPTLFWRCNESLNKIIPLASSGLLGGRVNFHKYPIEKYLGNWVNVPSFCLKYSTNSVNYVAGLFAGAVPVVINNVGYARFKHSFKWYINDLRIPIEKVKDDTGKNRFYFYTSPIWVALFTPKMPQEIRESWLKIRNPYLGDTYAPILWKTYIDKIFKRKGIPFLNCSRTVYYKHNCPEGAMEKLDRLRVELDLTEIDNRIIEMIKLWGIHESNIQP